MKDRKENNIIDLKIIVIGNGKANTPQFINKWTKNSINDKYEATIVSEFSFKIIENEGKFYRIQIFDLAMQDHNYSILKIFVKDSQGIIFMTDAKNIETRKNIIKLKNNVEYKTFLDEIPCILVENNIDLLHDDEIDDPTFEEFCEKNGFVKGFRVSSKTGENVDEAMTYFIKFIIKRTELNNSKKNHFH